MGAALVSRWTVEEALLQGTLVELLPAWQAAPLPVHLVYPVGALYANAAAEVSATDARGDAENLRDARAGKQIKKTGHEGRFLSGGLRYSAAPGRVGSAVA